MPITISKGKVKLPTKPVPQKNEVETLEPEKLTDEELVDQYGKLQDLTEAMKANPIFAQLQLVQEELQRRLDTHEPDEIIKIIATDYELEAGACALAQRKITDPLKVMAFIGPETFAKIAKIGVADAEKYLVPEQFEQVVSGYGFTKNRKINVKYLGGNKKVK
jgi:hypothetical protein